MNSESFSDGLRQRLREASRFCPTCGQPTTKGGVRALAARIGVHHSTLWRFMHGEPTKSDTIDAIVRFLG